MAQLRWQRDIGAVIATQVWDPGGPELAFIAKTLLRPTIVLLVQDL